MSIRLLSPVIAGSHTIESLPAIGAERFGVFDPQVVEFTHALSGLLLKTPAFRQFPELIALGFWLRKANILTAKNTLSATWQKPLGLVVHYTPKNVDTMFIYSWVCSLLMGNANVVRMASSTSELQQALIGALNALFTLPEYEQIAKANQFIQYDRQDQHTGSYLSQHADGRVIWGGDDAVLTIRSLPAKPRCRDISFADRYSGVLINGDQLRQDEIAPLAEKLYRDIQPFSQQACSSPKLIFWLGSMEGFDELMGALNNRYQSMPPVYQRNEQLLMAQNLRIANAGGKVNVHGRFSVITLDHWRPEIMHLHTGQDCLWLLPLADINQIAAMLHEKLQTLTYWGVEKEALIKIIDHPSIQGVDRVVPVGEALAFSTQWDGYELLGQLARQVVCK